MTVEGRFESQCSWGSVLVQRSDTTLVLTYQDKP